MRIFILLPGLQIGGMERAAVTLANSLSKRGHIVTVVTYGNGDDPLASDFNKEVHYINKGLKPHPIMKRIPWVRYRWYDDGMWETRTSPERLYKYYVGTEKYDVEIAFFRGLPIKTLSAKRKYRYPPRRLAWVHNDFTKAVGWNYNFKRFESVKDAYASYDKVVCVSNQAKDGFIKTIGDTGNLTTIYNLLPVQEIISKGKESPAVNVPLHKFNIVLVARLNDDAKGQRRLIDAVAALQKEGIDIGVTLVGGGIEEGLILKHIVAKEAENFIHMVGNQKNPYPYIRQADLLVCASYYEGYNLTVAEALILGTPVLSTRCTGPVEILADGKYGMIVENSTGGLGEGLKRFALEPQILNFYTNRAIERLDFFDEDVTMAQIERIIKE